MRLITNRICVLTAVLAGALSVLSCSRTIAKLAPAPGATVVPGPGNGATTAAAGVRLTARTEAWQWEPADLKTKVTPILLDLQNDGATPVAVRFNHIFLTDADGHRFSAMPPYDVNGTVTEAQRIDNPFYGFDRFTVAPYLTRWYPRLRRYEGAFAYDAAYYSPYLTQYQRVKLPTIDMVQRALPEGVLGPGGHVTGFVYFEPLHRDARTVTVNVEMLDANSNAVVGTARIPFVAR
jgi:hypothetical protein